jgi:hypothetical protein
MTPDEKLCYSEGMLWRNRVKAQSIAYSSEVVREDPYALIPADADRSLTYHNNRVRVSQTCLAQPDMFAQQNAAAVALDTADPVLIDDLGLKGAVINLWEVLSGGIPPAPPTSRTIDLDDLRSDGLGVDPGRDDRADTGRDAGRRR